ncbi:MAG: ribonuclease G [Paracoccaceae bacterium]|jgi:ribonuclease G
MKGRIAVLDRINGREAAALIVNGRLEDLLIDPISDNAPQPGAIYRATSDRPIKGQNGLILKLGDGQKGYLRQAKGIAPGTGMLVQVATQVESGKAAPVVLKLLFKGRNAILTPDATGLNIARSIKDEDERERLAEIANIAMQDAPDGLGLILRSAAALADGDAILDEIAELRQTCEGVMAEDINGPPELLVNAPNTHYLAWRDWSDPDPDQVHENEGGFDDYGVWEMLEALQQPFVQLPGQASMFIEPTRALTAIDVNTGGDFSFAAGLKANLSAARDLPRQLRLRGIGGQIVIDFAPLGKKDRRQVELAIGKALRADKIDTNVVGWTPLGHLELQRKRERIPLGDLLS